MRDAPAGMVCILGQLDESLIDGIRSCPCCGGLADVLVQLSPDLVPVLFKVACNRCELGTGWKGTRDQALNVWQRRGGVYEDCDVATRNTEIDMPFDALARGFRCNECGDFADPACLVASGVFCEECADRLDQVSSDFLAPSDAAKSMTCPIGTAVDPVLVSSHTLEVIEAYEKAEKERLRRLARQSYAISLIHAVPSLVNLSGATVCSFCWLPEDECNCPEVES